VETGELSRVAFGYYLGAAVMILGGLTEVFLGVNAEQKPLEDVAEPLSAESVWSTRQDLISACRPGDHGPAPDRPREPGRLSSPLIRTGG
jgi:hypothetical protein